MSENPSPAAMNRLQSELHRLYLPQSDDPGVRAMVLELSRPAEWPPLAALWQGVQADLALPAPAIAVSGVDGYQLWFSLAKAIPGAQAEAFLDTLRGRYLGDVAPRRVRLVCDPLSRGDTVPALQEKSGHWSAFVTPDLASIFADDPWLDRAPNSGGQADILCRIQSIAAPAFEHALATLQPSAMSRKPPLARSDTDTTERPTQQKCQGTTQCDGNLAPREFLHRVMNDASVEMLLRIDAAKALLPYTQ